MFDLHGPRVPGRRRPGSAPSCTPTRGATKSYSFIGVPEGHHDLSHHGGDPEKHEKIKKINRFHIEQFAYLLEQARSRSARAMATLLDHSMLVYGSGIGDGNRHNHNNLPILLAGQRRRDDPDRPARQVRDPDAAE